MRLLLQLVYEDGTTCIFPAGGPIELNLIDEVVKEVVSRGVSFKTESHVENDLREGIKKVLYDFKSNSLVLIRTL